MLPFFKTCFSFLNIYSPCVSPAGNKKPNKAAFCRARTFPGSRRTDDSEQTGGIDGGTELFFWFNIKHIRHALTTSTSTPLGGFFSPWNQQRCSPDPRRLPRGKGPLPHPHRRHQTPTNSVWRRTRMLGRECFIRWPRTALKTLKRFWLRVMASWTLGFQTCCLSKPLKTPFLHNNNKPR